MPCIFKATQGYSSETSADNHRPPDWAVQLSPNQSLPEPLSATVDALDDPLRDLAKFRVGRLRLLQQMPERHIR
ncbi:MAG: hypothetical protein JWN99_3408 [Ilumatobacteraceae bacterium]|nr:hypothetical protein [Ilumatobacteraceae bacterium]